jgi:tetratricopeptide (TPR) repeat protein
MDVRENSLSVLCFECRQERLKLRVPLKIKVFLVAVCAVFLFSLIMFIPVFSSYHNYVQAEKHIRAKEYALALEKYYLILEKYDSSVPLIMKAADAAMNAQYFGSLADILDTYLAGKNLTDSEYTHAMKYSDFLDAFIETYSEIDVILQEISDNFTAEDDPEIVKQFAFSKIEALLERTDTDKAYVYYSLGNIAPDSDIAQMNYGLSMAQNPELTYMYAQYGNALRRQGDFDKAKQIFNTAIGRNMCDALSWRGLGVIQLLEGQKSSGLKSIQYAYKLEPDGLYVPEALIIAMCENEMRDDAMAFLEQLISGGYQIEEDLQNYLDGKTSIDQYFLD